MGYEQKNPSKIQDLDGLFEKYLGRENELFQQVCEKYQANAEELIAELPSTSGLAQSVDAGAATGFTGGRQGAVKEEAGDEYAHLEYDVLPELAATEYAVLIQSIYEKYNPKKLQDMGRLLQKFRNRERELYHEVCKKYDVHPVKFRARYLKEE